MTRRMLSAPNRAPVLVRTWKRSGRTEGRGTSVPGTWQPGPGAAGPSRPLSQHCLSADCVRAGAERGADDSREHARGLPRGLPPGGRRRRPSLGGRTRLGREGRGARRDEAGRPGDLGARRALGQ
uniref:Uncharacterized protein n=1 Tax=Pipistrellus kuhlii TaxID=59472 RepID=A0A7J7V0T4_PIPKU|nr:hypothetical protein mPipKuh1_008666 [Pipistrellus kuhlii]